VTFEGASIQGLNLSIGHVLCLAANSTVTIVDSQFVGNAAAMIHVQDASLTIINTTIKDNACSLPDQGRTGVTVEGNSVLHIQGSQFVNNSHNPLEAPALYIAGSTRATITTTTFSSNRVEGLDCQAGSVRVLEDATGRQTCAPVGRGDPPL
jgi:hypothetical protein